jgi:hypothetical protein
MRHLPVLSILAFALFVASCASGDVEPAREISARKVAAEPCEDRTGVLASASFVLVTTPRAGATVEPGFEVAGCSRTFESTVQWRLVGRDGTVLARGFASGGGVDGPAPFRFVVEHAPAEPLLVHLETFELDASDGEGFPPGRTVLPLVLRSGKDPVSGSP